MTTKTKNNSYSRYICNTFPSEEAFDFPQTKYTSLSLLSPTKFLVVLPHITIDLGFGLYTIIDVHLQFAQLCFWIRVRAFSQFPNSWLKRSIPPLRNSPPFNSMNSPHLHLLISKKKLSILSPEQIELGKMLFETGQVHFLENWPDPGVDNDDDKKALLAQVILLAARLMNKTINFGNFYMLSF
ncbi:unnamed protein product [Lactuca virosa]|uniref:Uncharacterized protein n=1 Tax=Lactuca virosa TaxID=75947 RepID=A0AAU9P8N0_9ASTR|nr:unnamed protein product [Lactuca virosa]